MTILIEPKKRKIKYFFGKCNFCGCVFRLADFEIPDYSSWKTKYGYCPNKECINKSITIQLYPKKKDVII